MQHNQTSMQAELSHLLAQYTTLQSTHVLITKAYAESEANAAANMKQIAHLRDALNARKTPSPAPPESPLSPPPSNRTPYQQSASALDASPKYEMKVPDEVDTALSSNHPPIASISSSQGAQGFESVHNLDSGDAQSNSRTPSVPFVNLAMNLVQNHPQLAVPISETSSSVGVVMQPLTKSSLDTQATPTPLPRPYAIPSADPLPASASSPVQTPIEGASMNADFSKSSSDQILSTNSHLILEQFFRERIWYDPKS